MDSRVDAPVILTDEYAKSMAYATMDGIAKVADLKKKTVNEIDVEYRVITKPVQNMADAILVKDKLASAGYDSFIVASKVYYEV